MKTTVFIDLLATRRLSSNTRSDPNNGSANAHGSGRRIGMGLRRKEKSGKPDCRNEEGSAHASRIS